MAFADLDDCMDLAEDYIKFLIAYVLENSQADLQFFDDRIKKGQLDYLKNILL